MFTNEFLQHFYWLKGGVQNTNSTEKLATFAEKIQTEYEELFKSWEKMLRSELYQSIEQVCIANSILLGFEICGVDYNQVQLESLLKYDRPLDALMGEYKKQIGFPITLDMRDMLRPIENSLSRGWDDWESHIDTSTDKNIGHTERMQLLMSKVDASIAEYQGNWNMLDLNEVMDNSIKILTFRQMQQTLKSDAEQYSSAALDYVALFKSPLESISDVCIGERNTRPYTLELEPILQSLQLQKRVADALIEEACRQWCDFIAEAPERLTGEGFADFYREIVQQKKPEYEAEMCELMEDEMRNASHNPANDETGPQMNM